MGLLAVQLLFRRASLDARLALGELALDRALALRAAQLGTARGRRRIAAGLERALADSGGRFSSAVPVDQRAIAAAHSDLVELVATLRASDDVAPHGVARAARLLTDVASPLYAPPDPSALRDEVHLTLFWLDPSPQPDLEASRDRASTEIAASDRTAHTHLATG